jgi:hypothetical protein
VYDRCKKLHLPVRGVNVGEAAASRENCGRLRDELWFKGREWFQDRACSMPKDDALIAELASPTYAFTSTGKMVVESKADMKKRGMRSPDLPIRSEGYTPKANSVDCVIEPESGLNELRAPKKFMGTRPSICLLV